MNNKCKYLRYRRKKGQIYLYCTIRGTLEGFNCCKGCLDREYKKVPQNALKKVNKLSAKKPINKVSKTNKITKATSISKEVKMKVWERDNHCCIFCHKPVAWNFANSHYIKRSHLGLGIEENIMTNCNECHNLFEREPTRSEMLPIAKNYLKSKYEDWNEDMLVYKKY